MPRSLCLAGGGFANGDLDAEGGFATRHVRDFGQFHTHFFGVAMENFPKLAAQLRGARALLGWSQSYLAEGISVRRMIIADLESCKREPQEATLSALITELSAAGIVFTETGVEFLEWPPRPYVPTGCTTIKKRARRRWCSRTLHAIS